MNERIEELKRQAQIWCDQNIPDEFNEISGGYGKTWEDKFAQLILKDCLDMCLTKVGNGDYNRGRMDCYDNIKEHFGVEK